MQLQASPGPLSLTDEIDGLLLRAPKPSVQELADFLKLYVKGPGRDAAGRALIARGVDQAAIVSALAWLDVRDAFDWKIVWGVASTISMAASAYHGYRRNQSVGWAIWWALMGAAFPIFVPVLALAQGFGRRKAA